MKKEHDKLCKRLCPKCLCLTCKKDYMLDMSCKPRESIEGRFHIACCDEGEEQCGVKCPKESCERYEKE